jgi:hypothetical protein
MSQFEYATYPRFKIKWDDHALAAVLYRLLNNPPPPEQSGRLVWLAAWLAREAGFRVTGGYSHITIELPEGLVALPTYGNTGLYGAGVVRAFTEQQLAGLPLPNPAAMRYGVGSYEPEEAPAT